MCPFRLHTNLILCVPCRRRRRHDRALYKMHIGHMLFHLLRVLASATAAALLRRHLMVWKIFAPRFLFDAAFSLTVSALALIVFAFIMRVDLAAGTIVTEVSRWGETINDRPKAS